MNLQTASIAKRRFGYTELGMFEDANAELENVDPFNRTTREVLSIRAAVYHGLKRWELLRIVALHLTRLEPENVQWVISLAYATRRAVSIECSRDILAAAQSRFPKEAIIPFNLACYACQLGELEAAKDHLTQVFGIDPQWRQVALDDKDLEPLWSFLDSTSTP